MGLTLQDTFNNTEPTVVGEHIRASVDPEVTSPISNPTEISTQVHLPTTLFEHPTEVDLLSGWNIIGYPHPYENSVPRELYALVFNQSPGNLSDGEISQLLYEEGIQIVKANDAAVYWPEYNFNGIGDFIPGQGYQLRTYHALPGKRWKVSPSIQEFSQTTSNINEFLDKYGNIEKYTNEVNSIEVDVLAGWNIIGYNRYNAEDPSMENQLSSNNGVDINNIQIVKANDAAVYWPYYNFNGIGDFIPGQGYQLRAQEAFTARLFSDASIPDEFGIPLYLEHPDASSEDQSSIDNF